MDKGQRYLVKNSVLEVLLVTALILVIDFGPPVLIAYLMGMPDQYWFVTGVWIFTFQFCYFTYLTYQKTCERLDAYNAIMQAVRDAADIYNTEESLIKEKEVGPN